MGLHGLLQAYLYFYLLAAVHISYNSKYKEAFRDFKANVSIKSVDSISVL
jgi:hypothetical protein